MTLPLRWEATCEGCGERLDPREVDEYGHVCDGWWDDHGVFDPLPLIHLVEVTPKTQGLQS